MARSPRAYYLEGRRVTPSQFKRLSRARKIAAMVEWFGENFEDPANSVSYNSREGGYLWGGNGPHDADEELQDQFSDIADFDTIQDAVSEVTSEGTFEWASSYDPDDYEAPEDEENDGISGIDQPLPDWTFDAPDEEPDLRTVVLARLDDFEAKLDAYAAQRAHRGHNHPPELVEDEDPLADEDLAAGRRASIEIRAESAKEDPDAGIVARAAAVIASISRKLWGAMKTVATDVRSGIIGNTAFAGAQVAVYAYREELAAAAAEAASAAGRWVEHLQVFW